MGSAPHTACKYGGRGLWLTLSAHGGANQQAPVVHLRHGRIEGVKRFAAGLEAAPLIPTQIKGASLASPPEAALWRHHPAAKFEMDAVHRAHRAPICGRDAHPGGVAFA